MIDYADYDFIQIWLLFSFYRLSVFSVLVSRMDPALLRQGELFKKRALSTPAVEKRPTTSNSGSHKKKQAQVNVGSSSESDLSAGR